MADRKRDYKKEYEWHAQPLQRKLRSMRNQARRAAEKKFGKDAIKGKDIDHIKPLSKGGSNKTSNLRIQDPSVNRSRNLKSKKNS